MCRPILETKEGYTSHFITFSWVRLSRFPMSQKLVLLSPRVNHHSTLLRHDIPLIQAISCNRWKRLPHLWALNGYYVLEDSKQPSPLILKGRHLWLSKMHLRPFNTAMRDPKTEHGTSVRQHFRQQSEQQFCPWPPVSTIPCAPLEIKAAMDTKGREATYSCSGRKWWLEDHNLMWSIDLVSEKQKHPITGQMFF